MSQTTGEEKKKKKIEKAYTNIVERFPTLLFIQNFVFETVNPKFKLTIQRM